MLATALIAIVCLAILSRQSIQVFKKRQRFSLRDLLVAAIIGLLIGMSKEGKEGIPRQHIYELERDYEAAHAKK
jgi:hypothetical protein